MEVQRWRNMASNHLESMMNDQDTQQLIYQSGRWPWRWFKLFREAASIADRERVKFNLLREEHHLLKLESTELHKQRLDDAERIQELRADIQSLKIVERRNVELSIELKAMNEERASLLSKHNQMSEGVKTMFEFIRRNKVNDDHGREIPPMPPFPNIFRQ